METKNKEQPLIQSVSRRCGAKTRKGGVCLNPPVTGKTRCRMHGGAKGSGAPIGNKNALKHGFYSLEAINERKEMRAFVRKYQEMLESTKRSLQIT